HFSLFEELEKVQLPSCCDIFRSKIGLTVRRMPLATYSENMAWARRLTQSCKYLCDLHNGGCSVAVVKALEQLAQQGKIKEKVYGKQKIYFPDQERFGNVSDSELKGLDNEISELSCKVQTLQQNCRHMESELKELKGSMTTPEMVKEIEDLKKDCANYTEKLERIKSAANHVTPEEKEKVTELPKESPVARTGMVYNEKKLYCKEWRRRKRMATELLDAILEGYPKSKKQFFEEVGIETDEDFNVTLPTI
ncbi:hypothetical protein JD844_002361, partial [Phrynosoma platyrhinos]